MYTMVYPLGYHGIGMGIPIPYIGKREISRNTKVRILNKSLANLIYESNQRELEDGADQGWNGRCMWRSWEVGEEGTGDK